MIPFNTRGVLFLEHVPGSFCTHEETFSILLNLPRDLAPKYLTSLILWSILWGGSSAPEDELSPEIVGTHGGA